MGVNKVEYYGETLIDTTGTTVSEDTLMEGETAINAAGEIITGNLKAVQYKAQSPTAEEQAQARENIDALGTDDLPEAINTALTQAKESGEFDGKDGQDGQDGHDGSDGIGIMTIEQVTVSSEDGAKNVWRMTLTNGQTADFVVENGAKGTDGKDGKSAYEVAQEAGFTGIEEEFGDMLNKCISGAHEHRWDQIIDRPFGDFPTEEGIDTVTSDDVVYGKYHRVSEFIPTYEDLQQGGTITYYRVSGGAITGGLQTITFPQGDYTIRDTNNGIMINSDGVPMVIVSYNGKPQFGAITISDITEPGVYFDQGDYGKCIHSLKINGYDGFKLYEARPIPKKYLPDDIGAVKTVNYISPDANGNINIEVSGESSGGGSSKSDVAFKYVGSGTLAWNGDTSGNIIVSDSSYSEYLAFVRVSDAIPTLEDFQNGFSLVWGSGDAYDCTASDVLESGNYIRVDYNSAFVIKEDNTIYTEGDATLTFPKKGTYLVTYTGGGLEDFISELTINNYTGFTKPILKIDSLPSHGHDWYGNVVKAGNTVLNDNTQTGTYVKVSDAVPTEAELRKGGVVRYYAAVDGVMSDELTIGNYLESPYDMSVFNNGITINIGFEFPVIISFNGNPKFGAITFNGVTEPGVYFCQGEYTHTHSLTINEYTGFTHNVEKVPAELIPEGGGVSSWNDLTDKPFYETTTYSDAITWDGNTSGLVNAMGMFYHVSDVIPTLEDLQQGGSLVFGGNEIPFANSNVLDVSAVGMGNDAILILLNGSDPLAGVVLKAGATVTMQGMTAIFERAGIYFMNSTAYGAYTSSLTINNYRFVENKIKTLDPKYLPNNDGVVFLSTNMNMLEPYNATAICNKTYTELMSMSDAGLSTAIIQCPCSFGQGVVRAISVERGQVYIDTDTGYVNAVIFNFLYVIIETLKSITIM
ncbi:MAG: hypothetical protein IJA50_03765, partial [Firmicutes bacterium]|nr:hypothetical protein [Bacillota bacterium]